jgi:glutamyl-tRNA reductase
VNALEAVAPLVRPHLYVRDERAGIEHLFRVASSLDSLVVGEPQILGQLKDAFACARGAHAVGPWLNRAFEHAFRVAKRVRSETALGAGQVSIPTVAVDLAREIFSELAGHKVVLVGTGEMATGRDLAGQGRRAGLRGWSHRSIGRARWRRNSGAEPRSGRTFPACWPWPTSWSAAPARPATWSRWSSWPRRGGSATGEISVLVDLAVPRDVDPRIADLDGVFLYNVDDLSHVADAALADRRREAERAPPSSARKPKVSCARTHAERITPTLVALRERFPNRPRSRT